MVQIDSSHVKGESGTGYEGPEGGTFACHNCEYFKAGSCGQSTMMKVSKLPRVDGGRVKVAPDGCCEYVDRIGKAKPGRHWLAGGN